MNNILSILFEKFWTGLLAVIAICTISYFINYDKLSALSFIWCITYFIYQVKKIKLVRTIWGFFFNSWWRHLIIVLASLAASIYFDDEFLLLFTLILAFASLFHQFTRNKTWVVVLNSILMFVIIIICFLGLFTKAIFPSKHRFKESNSLIQ